MSWIRRTKDKPAYEGKHCSKCIDGLPPIYQDGERLADLGDIWQCDHCGLLWRVYEPGEGPWSDYWWPAGWWTRFMFWVTVGPRRIA